MSSEDRIAGALLGMAAGDALGAGYEFADLPRGEVAMIGGGLGGFAPGECTDDTSMAVCIAEVTATGTVDVEAIGDRFIGWQRSWHGPLSSPFAARSSLAPDDLTFGGRARRSEVIAGARGGDEVAVGDEDLHAMRRCPPAGGQAGAGP